MNGPGEVTGSRSPAWRSRWAAVGAAMAVTLGAGGLAAVDAESSDPSSFVAVTPTRVLDTRDGDVNVGLGGAFASGTSRKLLVTGTIDTSSGPEQVVPPGATGIVFNLTLVRPSTRGYASVRPGDASGIPSTSTLNFAAGAKAANGGTVSLPVSGANAGQIDIFFNGSSASASTDILLDITGYYTRGSGLPGPAGPIGPTGPPGAPGSANRISDEQIALLQWYEDPGAPGQYRTGSRPEGLAFDGTSIWIANNGSDSISRMNPADGTKVTYATGRSPRRVAFDGTNIWITNSGDDTVSRMNPSNGAKVDYPTGSSPAGLAFDGTNIWITNRGNNTVSKMKPSDGTRVDYPTGDYPSGVAFDGTSIWVVNSGYPSTVQKINPEWGGGVSYPAAEGSSEVAYDGTNIWITSAYYTATGLVSKMDPDDGTRIDYAGGNGGDIVFDGTNVWVTNQDSATVSKILPR